MENLNPEQLKAVLHKSGPLLIVAGAGTGKTTVISQKIGYIIEQGWAKSDEILALTFTEKAAGEMEERVDRLLPMGYLDLWIATFHGFAEKIIKLHGLEIGLPTEFKLLNGFEQWILVNKNLDRFKLDYYRPAGNPTKFIEALLKHFSRLKDEDISPADYLRYTEGLKGGPAATSGPRKAKAKKTKEKIDIKLEIEGIEKPTDEMIEQEVTRLNEVANAYQVYQQLLLENGAMDFGDLINYCLRLLKERPVILEKYRQQFKYVLVDEFQDTNWSQYELVKLLAPSKANLIVVGDDDQSIYRFRGASMSNILQFKKDYPATKQVILTKNYRNKQNILDLSYDFIKLNNPNRLECQLNEAGSQKKDCILNKQLQAQSEGVGEIAVLYGNDLDEEVSLVINKIVELKNNDPEVSWSDFAILVRANDSAKEFCAVLDREALPYQFLASRGLYAKPVIMDIFAYLNLLDDYHESRSMYRVLNLPMFGFSYGELVSFNYQANRKSWSLFETLRNASSLNLAPEVGKKIYRVMNLIFEHSKLAREKNASEVVLAFLNDSGYLKHLASLEPGKSREIISFLNQFMKRIKTFEAGSDDRTVKAFLNELRMEIDSGEEGSLVPDFEAGPEAIKIMTVHAAKGLEFKYVFVANLVDKRFPAIERHEAIAVPNALVKEIVPGGDTHLEEERRLFYVAVTRAKQGLYFSWANDYGGARKKKPSRFLVECGFLSEQQPTRGKKASEAEDAAETLKVKPRANAEAARPLNFKLPSYLSYTQLAAFSNCPYQYHFAHILRIPSRGKGVFSFGKTMHSTLQKLFELIRDKRGLGQGELFGAAAEADPKITWEEVLALYRDSWIDEWYASKRQKEEYLAKGEAILKDFYHTYKDNWPDNNFTEKGFNLKIKADGEYYTVRGVMDRIDKVDGKLKIIDYKTGKPKEKLTFEEKEQLLIYQLAAAELFRDEVGSLAYYYLDNNSEVEFLGTPAELEKLEDKIVTTITDIKKGEFPPKPSPLCKYCDFFDICEFRKS